MSCAHCGLPASPGDPAFCCAGCEAVYTALRDEGLSNFYNLRAVAPEGVPGPAQVAVEALNELDEATFLEAHSRNAAEGLREIELYLDGVHCAGCVWLVERMPHALNGVALARLDLSRARLTLRWWPKRIRLSSIARWLARFGYKARPVRATKGHERRRTERGLLLRVGICWALAGNAMLLASALYAGLDEVQDATMTAAVRWASLALSLGSVAAGGTIFLRRAWGSLLSLRSDGWSGLPGLSMDVPIALGILVGWGHSAVATVTGSGEIWFDSVAVLIAALLTARWLQVRGQRFAGDAADRLLSILPTTARRLRGNGQFETVSAEQLRAGDLIEVRAGEVLPADGQVVSGNSALERAALTGESRPEPVGIDSTVHAGATNLRSPLQVRVAAVGDQTRVGALLRWIEVRSQRRAPTVQLADRLGGVFVVTVLGMATVAAAVWWYLEPVAVVPHTVALLVIACPCALGMATPLTLAVAVGRAARRGIFIKHEDVLERLAGATCVVFDKTGTLTLGRMSVLSIYGDEAALHLGAHLEQHSAHPIAAALCQWAGPGARATDVREVPGAGIEGRVQGRWVRVGSPSWIPGAREQARHAARQGHTPVVVEVDGQVSAVASLGDPLRPDARSLVAELQQRGVHCVLLSGDHPAVAKTAGQRLGLPPGDVHGGVTPEGKRAFVEALTAPGRAVVMVGDGVNDAAALQVADVGIAVHGGAAASLVAADIFTARPGLSPVLELLASARVVQHVVRRGLLFSALYNALGVTAAALGVVSPLGAAVAMPISSLAVVASALFQRSFAPTQSARATGHDFQTLPANTSGSAVA